MIDVLILTGDAETSKFEQWPVDKKSGNLKQLQEAVGGSIEMPFRASGVDIYCNSEGFIQQLPQNEGAAYLVYELTGNVGLFYGPFVFVFCGARKKAAREKAETWFAKYQRGEIPEESGDEDDV